MKICDAHDRNETLGECQGGLVVRYALQVRVKEAREGFWFRIARITATLFSKSEIDNVFFELLLSFKKNEAFEKMRRRR